MASLIKILDNAKFFGKTIIRKVSSPTPTYTIGRSIYNVNEGSSVIFTLSTTNVSDGTTIPYTISGISLSDLSSGSLSGNFTVSNNLATASVALTADNLTEGTEQIAIALNNGQASSFALVTDTSISLPMTLSGTNLVGWYDYTYGAFNRGADTNGFGVTDDNKGVQPSWLNVGSYPYRVSFTTNLNRTQTTVNERVSYSGYTLFDGSTDFSQIPFDPNFVKSTPQSEYALFDTADISLYWTGLNWRLTINSFYWVPDELDPQYNTNYTPNSIYWDATGDTAYPWEANWGSGKTLNHTVDNSIKATEGQTISIWYGRIGPALTQDTLALQPVLSAGSIQFNSKWMSLYTFPSQFATRTYYFVGNSRNTQSSTTRSILNFGGVTSTASTMRHALVMRNSSNAQRYGLSQGSTTAAQIQSTYAPLSSWTGKPQIVCASFSSANNGKISLNNSAESSLTAIGNNFLSQTGGINPFYVGSSDANSFTNVKEILVFDTVHSTEQKTQVINYLNAKYNAF